MIYIIPKSLLHHISIFIKQKGKFIHFNKYKTNYTKSIKKNLEMKDSLH